MSIHNLKYLFEGFGSSLQQIHGLIDLVRGMLERVACFLNRSDAWLKLIVLLAVQEVSVADLVVGFLGSLEEMLIFL